MESTVNWQQKKIGFGLTGSHCTYEIVISELKKLLATGAEIIPFVTSTVQNTDTRFGEARYWVEQLEKLTGHKVVDNIVEAEPFGAKTPLDCMVIAPMTGVTMSKITNAQYDNAVLTATKSTLRNLSPIVLFVSTNDGLGLSGVNLMKLMATKNIYFIPFGQDDPVNKPNSLVAKAEYMLPTIEGALIGKQIQPVLVSY